MIRLRRGIAKAARERRPGLVDVEVDLEDGGVEPAVAYTDLCGPVRPGDRLVLNTTAVALGLGTGGLHFVIAVDGGAPADPPAPARAMKLRYTPLQVAVAAVEESGSPLPDSLEAMPVVAAGLHSAVAPVAIGARATRSDARVALVLTDGGALPAAFSDTIPALREAGLISTVITCGHAFGGDLEAVNVYTGLLAARASGAGVAVVAMGPGNLGTGSRYGFATMEVAGVVNAAAALGGRPIVVARISFADVRDRHRGVSHHTLTALSACLAPATVPLPPLTSDRETVVRSALEPLAARHTIAEVDLGGAEEALRRSPVALRSMGRGYADDPDAFRAAAAAGVYAAT